MYRATSVGEAVRVGFQSSWKFIVDAWTTIKRILLGQVSGENLGGIITIGAVSYSWASVGMAKLLFFLCMLSMNLAFLNVLPIPVLDGGHLLFLLIEKIKGSPVSERVLGYSQLVGIVLILSLMIYVTYNDLVRWPCSSSLECALASGGSCASRSRPRRSRTSPRAWCSAAAAPAPRRAALAADRRLARDLPRRRSRSTTGPIARRRARAPRPPDPRGAVSRPRGPRARARPDGPGRRPGLRRRRGGGLWMAALASCAAFYDLAGRGPLLGPVLLGLCRAGNLGAGLCWSSGYAPPAAGLVLVAGLYGFYVFNASRLGRMEDREDEVVPARARRLLVTAMLAFPLLAFAAAPARGPPRTRTPARGSAGPRRRLGLVAAARRGTWSPADVERAMGLLLRRLLAFDAVLALASARFPAAGWDGVAVAAVILAGYPLAHRLRRAFPPS